jgi:DNA-binding transcriptional regulator YhcF (GntR family)
MDTGFNADVPIFLQIAEMIENAIISGALAEDAQAPSTTEISVRYKINPATALKGITRLADEGVLYKKRGLGMFVAEGARKKILEKRQRLFYEKYMLPLMQEAKKLELSYDQLAEMLRRGCTI